MRELAAWEIEPGLWRWRADAACAGRQIVSTYCETAEQIVLVDPVLPADPRDAERFMRALERDIERTRLPLVAVATRPEHARDLDAVRARWGAAESGGVELLRVDDELAVRIAARDIVVLGHASREAALAVTGPARIVVGAHD